MNKSQIIDAVSSISGLTKADTAKFIAAGIKVIIQALKKGERVSIIGAGSFSIISRSTRTGRNPQTGKEIKITA